MSDGWAPRFKSNKNKSSEKRRPKRVEKEQPRNAFEAIKLSRRRRSKRQSTTN